MNFIKMTALGNDYIYIDMMDNTNLTMDSVISKVPALSDRNIGIGGDGVIFIYKNKDDIFAKIFNADGSEAEMCGNGLRCVARIVFDKKYVKENKFFINLKNRKVQAIVNEKDVTIDMGLALLEDEFSVNIEGIEYKITPVNVGNPHAVLFLDKDEKLENINIKKIGPVIENLKKFPNKTNVEFVKILSKDKIELRVWERGVGETKACGSGASASALVSFKKNYVKSDVAINMPGGTANVKISNNSIFLTGEAKYVYFGQYIL